MPTLPVEVLHDICGRLEGRNRDVANFRLESRLFAAVGIEYLFSTVYVAYHPDSLAVLMNISKHPIIRHRVRTVCYLTNFLRYFESYSEWLDVAAEWSSGDWSTDIFYQWAKERLTPAQCKAGWREYRRITCGQDELWKLGNDAKIFKSSLAQFSNLGEIQMFDSIVRAGELSDCNTSEYHPFRGSLVAHYESLHERASDDSLCPIFGVAQFRTILSALESCQSKLLTLQVVDLSWAAFSKIGSPLKHPASAVSCLDCLDMSIRTTDPDNIVLKDLGAANARDLIGSATNLRSLGIYFDMREFLEMESLYPLHCLFEDNIFPKLHTLRIVGVELTHNALFKFLQLHATTLTILHLGSCNLASELTWFDVFTKISTIIHLEEASLSGCFTVYPAEQSSFICMEDEIIGTDLRVGDALGMALCRGFTRWCNSCDIEQEASIDEEAFRSQIFTDLARNLLARGFPDQYSFPLTTFMRRFKNTMLLRRLSEARREAQLPKSESRSFYPDLAGYRSAELYKDPVYRGGYSVDKESDETGSFEEYEQYKEAEESDETRSSEDSQQYEEAEDFEIDQVSIE